MNNVPCKKTAVYVDDIPSHLSLVVPEGETLSLEMASFKNSVEAEIEVDVAKNATFLGAFADFSSTTSRFSLSVHLQGEGAVCEWRLAALADGTLAKTYVTSVCHEAPASLAHMSNYGIARDASKLFFSGVSEIKKGAKKSVTRQDAKIIVFDPKCDGKASPILKIDENDVEASHAAVVGRLNEEHLFYLESRGLDEAKAKRLITLGYLKPIEDCFSDPSLKTRIDGAIEGGV
jgi:Fe-S cluster assembly protein SufD